MDQLDRDLFLENIWTDGSLDSSDFKVSTIDLIEEFGPWGQKFPAPIFEGHFEVLEYRWLKEIHLKLKLALENGETVEAIAFNALDRFDFNPAMSKVHLVYELSKNEYKGNVSVQLQIKHLRH